VINRYYITLGAKSTAGGEVTSANHFDTINGVPAALERDTCWCPKCNSVGVIMPDGPRISDTFDGREAALSDDLCICKCSPPPRLVAAQDFAYQTVDADWHASKAAATAETAAKLNTAASSAKRADGIPLVLLDPDTQKPFKHHAYRLQLTDKVIEGTTDENGATKPLTAAERTSVVRWYVDGESIPG
jgi:uncharacterized Zn-binding protein involved in type VI secretion